MNLIKTFINGIYEENPVLRLLLGMCPTLAVTTSVINGIGMGIAATFVLVSSNIIVSSIRNITPHRIRIPVFIIVIASFTTMVDLFLNAFMPALHKSLGIFIPLIVVNCIIFGRAEAFASKNPMRDSVSDGLGMGVGFTLALILISAVRELFGSGTILGVSLFGANYNPALIMILPPGAFLVLGLLIGTMNLVGQLRKGKASF